VEWLGWCCIDVWSPAYKLPMGSCRCLSAKLYRSAALFGGVGAPISFALREIPTLASIARKYLWIGRQ